MQINLDPGSATNRITGYGDDFIVLNEERFKTSLIVMPEVLVTDWTPLCIVDLSAKDLHTVVELEPEIIILGTGSQQCFPDSPVLRPVVERGIGFEIMDTRAACRTYNILMAEGRTVAAALMIAD